MEDYKYNTAAEMFRDVFGEEAVTEVKPKQLTNAQIEKNKQLHKAICEYIKMIDEIFEMSKDSTMQFD